MRILISSVQQCIASLVVLYLVLMASGCSTSNSRDMANPRSIAFDYGNVWSEYWNDVASISIQMNPAYQECIIEHLNLLNIMSRIDSLTLRFLLEKAPDRIITQTGNAPWIVFDPREEEIADLLQEPEFLNTNSELEKLMTQWNNNPNQGEVLALRRDAVRSDAGELAWSAKDEHLNHVISRIREVQDRSLRTIYPSQSLPEPQQSAGSGCIIDEGLD